jgi:hypothetical protein
MIERPPQLPRMLVHPTFNRQIIGLSERRPQINRHPVFREQPRPRRTHHPETEKKARGQSMKPGAFIFFGWLAALTLSPASDLEPPTIPVGLA